MTSKKAKSGGPGYLKSLLDSLLSGGEQDKPSAAPAGTSSPAVSADIQKRAALETACSQLLRNKSLITSGKLEFIGFTQIKKRLGKRWPEFSKIIHATAEEIINAHLTKGDLSIRYKEDTYVLIFARLALAEGKTRAATIAEDIRQRLLAMGEPEFMGIEIAETVEQLEPQGLVDKSLSGLLETMAAPKVPAGVVQVETLPRDAPAPVVYSYLPLWESQKQALTAFFCLAKNPGQTGNDFEHHLGLFALKSPHEKLLLDLDVLETVDEELQKREEEGRRLLVACPVQYETLFHFESFEKYRNRLALLSTERRKCLIILVMKASDMPPVKDAYWFAAPLSEHCREVFIELPLGPEINFQYLADSGVTVAGVSLREGGGRPERDTISLLNSFSEHAKAAKITKTFMLDVASLSLTTYAVCAGFDYLGGPAIHESVKKPDYVYRYRHADLLADLMPKPLPPSAAE